MNAKMREREKKGKARTDIGTGFMKACLKITYHFSRMGPRMSRSRGNDLTPFIFHRVFSKRSVGTVCRNEIGPLVTTIAAGWLSIRRKGNVFHQSRAEYEREMLDKRGKKRGGGKGW